MNTVFRCLCRPAGPNHPAIEVSGLHGRTRTGRGLCDRPGHSLAQAAVRQAAQNPRSVKVQRVHSTSTDAAIVLFVGGTPELHALWGN